jgi:hypothetical protein
MNNFNIDSRVDNLHSLKCDIHNNSCVILHKIWDCFLDPEIKFIHILDASNSGDKIHFDNLPQKL